MRFKSAFTNSKWATTVAQPTLSSAENTLADANRERLNQLIVDGLIAENLVVLAGLGSSLCVKDAKGHTLAPTMASLWTDVKNLKDFDGIVKKVDYPATSGENVELLLSHCQLFQALHPEPAVADFITRAEGIIVSKCRFVDNAADVRVHESFLRKVARRSSRKPRMRLFTTNYDLCFEKAASSARFVVIDGFSHTIPQEFDGSYFNFDLVRRNQDRDTPDYIPNVFHLYKLHGSVDWSRDTTPITKDANAKSPAIIYPRLSKFELSYEQPLLEVMARFQSALRQPNTGLVIVGFGFNDNHIIQPILSAIHSNVGIKIIVIDPSLENSANPSVKEASRLIDEGDWRLTLVAETFEGFVTILPDLVAETEEEQHRKRIARAGGKP